MMAQMKVLSFEIAQLVYGDKCGWLFLQDISFQGGFVQGNGCDLIFIHLTKPFDEWWFDYTCWFDVYAGSYYDQRTTILDSKLNCIVIYLAFWSFFGSQASHHYEPNVEAYGRICCLKFLYLFHLANVVLVAYHALVSTAISMRWYFLLRWMGLLEFNQSWHGGSDGRAQF